MATKGSSENIPTSDKQDEVRRNAKKSRRPKHRTSQDGNHADQQSVFAEGRERQVAAIRRALPSGVNDNQRMFLEAMLSVYAELRRAPAVRPDGERQASHDDRRHLQQDQRRPRRRAAQEVPQGLEQRQGHVLPPREAAPGQPLLQPGAGRARQDRARGRRAPDPVAGRADQPRAGRRLTVAWRRRGNHYGSPAAHTLDPDGSFLVPETLLKPSIDTVRLLERQSDNLIGSFLRISHGIDT